MSKAWEKQQSCGTKWTNLIVPVLDLEPNQTTKKATNAWAVGRLGQCRACSRMRRRYNCCCTQCPSSDIHLRLAFPLAVCINSIRKPLATQTIHFEAHPNITHDLTDNACLIRGKHIGYISNMDSWALEPFLFSNWMLCSKTPQKICSSACNSASLPLSLGQDTRHVQGKIHAGAWTQNPHTVSDWSTPHASGTRLHNK